VPSVYHVRLTRHYVRTVEEPEVKSAGDATVRVTPPVALSHPITFVLVTEVAERCSSVAVWGTRGVCCRCRSAHASRRLSWVPPPVRVSRVSRAFSSSPGFRSALPSSIQPGPKWEASLRSVPKRTALRESPSARRNSATCYQPFPLSRLALVAARAEAKASSCCLFCAGSPQEW
jgi:hypothetical protein